jgi:hypothetical protein
LKGEGQGEGSGQRVWRIQSPRRRFLKIRTVSQCCNGPCHYQMAVRLFPYGIVLKTQQKRTLRDCWHPDCLKGECPIPQTSSKSASPR